MSLYENIKFSNDLIENEACNITYSGYLFEKNSTCVSIVYGFGPEWKHTTEQKMEKTDEGFVATVNMQEFETFNFCFKNLDNEWDNNYNQNYTSPISRPVITETQEIPEYDFILNNDNVITNILGNLFATDLSDASYNEPLQIDSGIIENAKKIESANKIEAFEVEVEINKPVNIEETLVNSTEVEGLNQDLENIFNEIYESSTEEISSKAISQESNQEYNIEYNEYENVESHGEFDMNNLINEILSPIVKSSIFDENVKDSFENDSFEQNSTVNFFDEFEDFEDDLAVDNKIDSLIADLFNNTKEARKMAEEKTIESNNEPLFIENNIEIETAIDETIDNIESTEDLEKAIDNRIEELLATGPISDVIENNNVENIEIQEDTKIENDVEFFEETEIEEESLIDSINNSEDSNELTSLIELPDENGFTVSPRALGKFYMFKKKIKLAFTKLFVAIPKYLSKGLNKENN